MIKECVECGVEFEAPSGMWKTCSDHCRNTRNLNNIKNHNKVRKENIRKTKKCKRCGQAGLRPRTQFCSAKCKAEHRDALRAEYTQSYHPPVVNCEHCGKERFKRSVGKIRCKCQMTNRIQCECIECGKSVMRTPSHLKIRPNVLCSVSCSEDWHRGVGRKHQWKIRLKRLWASIGVCRNCNLAFKKTKKRNNNICHACDRLLDQLLVSIRQQERRKEKLKQQQQRSLTRCLTCGEHTSGCTGKGRIKKYCNRKCFNKSDLGKKNKRIARQKRNAHKRMVHAESVDPIAVFERDNWRCAYCKCKVVKSNGGYEQRAATMDHVIPISKGGPHTYENIVTACQACNSKKGANIATLF